MSDLRWSVIAPVYFMSNLLFSDILNGLKEGTYAIALPPGLPLQQIATEDIGAFAAHVLANPDEFAGTRIDIAGDELSSQQSANVLAGILGQADLRCRSTDRQHSVLQRGPRPHVRMVRHYRIHGGYRWPPLVLSGSRLDPLRGVGGTGTSRAGLIAPDLNVTLPPNDSVGGRGITSPLSRPARRFGRTGRKRIRQVAKVWPASRGDSCCGSVCAGASWCPRSTRLNASARMTYPTA